MNEMILAGPAGQRMSSLEIAELMGKQHKNVLRDINSLIEQEAIDRLSFEPTFYTDDMNRKQSMFMLDFQATMTLITGYDAKRRSLVIKRWQELEKQAAAPRFTLPANFAEALRALACEVEMKELAITQRDEAIRTKALIGSRREATAMAAASVAVRQVNTLKDELGIGANWKTAKAITWIKDYFALSQGMWMVVGKKLKAISDEFGYEVRRVESEKFGQVNSYHVAVIEKLRARLEADDNMLGKYRAA